METIRDGCSNVVFSIPRAAADKKALAVAADASPAPVKDVLPTIAPGATGFCLVLLLLVPWEASEDDDNDTLSGGRGTGGGGLEIKGLFIVLWLNDPGELAVANFAPGK